MRISRVRVENFRSIKLLDFNIPNFCCLVGPNNAGKSNILLAIQKVIGRDWVSADSFNETDVFGIDPSNDITLQISFEPEIEYKKFKQGNPTLIKTLSFNYACYKIGEEKGERRLEQSCLNAQDKPPSVLAKALKSGESPQFQPLLNIPSEVRGAVPLIYIGTNRSLKDHLPSARYSMLRQLFEDIDRDLQDPKQTIKVKDEFGQETEIPRREQFRKLMEETYALLRTDNFKKLEASIKKHALHQLGFHPETDNEKLSMYFSPFETIDFYKSLDLRIREKSFTFSATDLGEGMQNALVIAILKAFEERRKQGAILLIEEPEMFMHPQMQRSLYKTLRGIAKTNQVIYTTHSPHFISIPDYNEIAIVRKNGQGTKVYQSTLSTDNKRKAKLIKELDPERNELFFATRLLLVEGDTEKLAIPAYAVRLKHDLDRSGTTIVEVGGKRNLPEFAQIAMSFGIPTGIVYDEDSSDFGGKDANEEEALNKTLDELAKPDASVKVWRLKKNYEDHLRIALGDAKYQEMCQKFPKMSKANRGRLIAMEADLVVPDPISEILIWLTNQSLEPATAK